MCDRKHKVQHQGDKFYGPSAPHATRHGRYVSWLAVRSAAYGVCSLHSHHCTALVQVAYYPRLKRATFTFIISSTSKSILDMNETTFTLRENEEYIELTQLLKIKQLAQSGGHAKLIVADGLVKRNGELELRKRKKLFAGDYIEIDNLKITIER